MVRVRQLLPVLVITICVTYLSFDLFEKKKLPENVFIGRTDSGPIRIVAHRHGDEFCIAYNVTRAFKRFRDDGMEPITLATHLTANYLHELLDQARSWSAPISASLYIDRPTEKAVELFHNIHRCKKNIKERVSLHIVFRLAPFEKECAPIFISEMDCGKVTDKYISSLIDSFRAPFSLYPINVMRNTARRGSPSRLQLLCDVEMEFSKNFPVVLKPLANFNLQNGGKSRIIIRRFEQNGSYESAPDDVAELQKRFKNKTLLEFHAKVYAKGHRIPDIEGWFKRSLKLQEPILTEVRYPAPSWEPQILLHSNDPESDEKAPTRQWDQQILVYELCRANYTFMVASHVFNVHPGIKKNPSPMEQAVSRYTKPLRNKAFANFRKRMSELYPDTVTRCKNFKM